MATNPEGSLPPLWYRLPGVVEGPTPRALIIAGLLIHKRDAYGSRKLRSPTIDRCININIIRLEKLLDRIVLGCCTAGWSPL